MKPGKIIGIILIVFAAFLAVMLLIDLIIDFAIPNYQKVLCEENGGIWEDNVLLFSNQCVMDRILCEDSGGTPVCGDGIGLSCKELCEYWLYKTDDST